MDLGQFNPALDGSVVIWSLTAAFAVWAGWLDWRTRKIPNWLTVGFFFIGLVARSAILGWRGTLSGLEGAGVALLILLPMVLSRGLGAGDWKLMGAVGALLGPQEVLVVLFASAMTAGFMALFLMIYKRRVTATLRNVFVLVQGFLIFGMKGNPEITIDNPSLVKLPFGVAAAVATLVCFVATRWAR